MLIEHAFKSQYQIYQNRKKIININDLYGISENSDNNKTYPNMVMHIFEKKNIYSVIKHDYDLELSFHFFHFEH